MKRNSIKVVSFLLVIMLMVNFLMPTTVYDASGETIYDPQICDRDYGSTNYSIFVGYYAVSSSN